MGSRSPRLVRRARCALTRPRSSRSSPVAGDAAAAQPRCWLRPVPGALARPFVAPVSRYGAGHRGADLVAALGTPVRAANAGEVSFAGSVAGSLHVVIAHAGNLRTSYSFLAAVGVRRGQRVARGDVVGTTGGGVDEHTGLFHFGLRVGDRYVDPMALFSPTDLTRLIRLVPVDEPAQRGLDPPALESRALGGVIASSTRPPGAEAEAEPGRAARRAGRARSGKRCHRRPGRGADRAAAGLARALLDRAGIRTPTAAFVADARLVASRLMDWARSRADCTSDTAAPASGGGSGHTALAVAGINSRTDPKTGTTLALDTKQLGYHDGEVTVLLVRAGRRRVRAEHTTGDLRGAAAALGDQLRALQRSIPAARWTSSATRRVGWSSRSS